MQTNAYPHRFNEVEEFLNTRGTKQVIQFRDNSKSRAQKEKASSEEPVDSPLSTETLTDNETPEEIPEMSGYQSGNFGGDLWVQIFSCCVNQPPPQQKRRHRHGRIERSMIGEPTNFQHTGHIGSGDMELVNTQLRVIQKQMQSKGGYEATLSSTTKAF